MRASLIFTLLMLASFASAQELNIQQQIVETVQRIPQQLNFKEIYEFAVELFQRYGHHIATGALEAYKVNPGAKIYYYSNYLVWQFYCMIIHQNMYKKYNYDQIHKICITGVKMETYKLF